MNRHKCPLQLGIEDTEEVPPCPGLPLPEDLGEVAAISVAVTHSHVRPSPQLPPGALVISNVVWKHFKVIMELLC